LTPLTGGSRVRVSGDVFKGVTLGVRGATVLNQMVGAVSFESFPCEARSIDDIIGDDFIKEFVVEIDYSRRVINLYDPKSFNYRGAGQLVPLKAVKSVSLNRKGREEGAKGAKTLNFFPVARSREMF
jgi:hypothetical protein